ncbi:lipid IV(A) 3-deoxy-D-manno-octulosonic acid transferase [Noviherbaspirillum denitrificans]|uniref:3-deoxy-D-manno-octulosonic acid transferase n=1 Tax=Noviherbaspirillum denitrificans TaxID=1968433 RepID=A0A254TE96_9BURK|nr:lipid IV(A) 3-deoxy-D-manno-octulosonic acid transferase [Noviherbaspirillum denitrificans]OWW18863.1 3-deoxy-D-manno-octulosonic acid transferase [Noviherbaspirillum denitrificans]
MRHLYSFAWWLALPLVLARLWWRGRKEPGYRAHMAERFGFYAKRPQRDVLWVHAVSVGETRAAEPLIDALLREYPNHAILLTHMTPTGRATGKSLFQKHGDRFVQCYLPYDTGFMVGRFLKHFRPRICILMETEVWPNLIAQCAKHRVPVALVNARLSERSLAKAERLSALMSDAARGFSCVAAQTDADADRLRRFGAPNVSVTGSIKFDVTPPEQALATGASLRAMMGNRPVLLCASTREGEEGLILDALDESGLEHVLLVIVPRHPQRFDEVAAKVAARGLSLQRRSQLGAALPDDMRVLLGDSMGEMFAYYTACDIAFIGGSLLPLGGQNLIEACAVGKPVLVGPHTFNFSVVSEEAIAAGAASRVETASDMLRIAAMLLSNDAERKRMGDNALAFARQHRGATERTIGLLKPLIR